MVGVITLYNKKTFDSEVLSYITKIDDGFIEELKIKLSKTITPSERERFEIRCHYFDSDFSIDEIIWEALNAIRE